MSKELILEVTKSRELGYTLCYYQYDIDTNELDLYTPEMHEYYEPFQHLFFLDYNTLTVDITNIKDLKLKKILKEIHNPVFKFLE